MTNCELGALYSAELTSQSHRVFIFGTSSSRLSEMQSSMVLTRTAARVLSLRAEMRSFMQFVMSR